MKSGRFLILVLVAAAWGCDSVYTEINPFLTLTETLGVGASQADNESGTGGTSTSGEIVFRQPLTLTFRNNNPSADLNTAFVAWVNVGSIRSAEQQDALLAGGYRQLTREEKLGTAHTLPIGTFVYAGGGRAGATMITLGANEGDTATTAGNSPQFSLELLTPDAILVFSQPPVSCDSVAFYYTIDGDPVTAVPVGGSEAPYSGATGAGAYKTLAQVEGYQCDPLRPGYFLNATGGSRATNQYFEGESVTVDFYAAPDAVGDFALVSFGQEAPVEETQP